MEPHFSPNPYLFKYALRCSADSVGGGLAGVSVGVSLRMRWRSALPLGDMVMSSEWIIGALAFVTIGGTLALAIFHFGFHLKDPKNLAAAKSVAEDRESATTRMTPNKGQPEASLRARLDNSEASIKR